MYIKYLFKTSLKKVHNPSGIAIPMLKTTALARIHIFQLKSWQIYYCVLFSHFVYADCDFFFCLIG